MTREPDSTAFDAIVASWRAEGDVPEWPEDWRVDEVLADPATVDPPGADRPAADPPAADHTAADHVAADSGAADPADEPGADALRRNERPGSLPPPDHPAPDLRDATRGGERADRADPANDADRPAIGPRADRPAGPRAPTLPRRTRPPPSSGTTRRAGSTSNPASDRQGLPPTRSPTSTSCHPSRRRCRGWGRRSSSGSRSIGLGLVLVAVPGWVGVPQVYSLPLGLVAIAAGLGWLVLRLWPDPTTCRRRSTSTTPTTPTAAPSSEPPPLVDQAYGRRRAFEPVRDFAPGCAPACTSPITRSLASCAAPTTAAASPSCAVRMRASGRRPAPVSSAA